MIEFSSFGCEEMLEGKLRHSLDGCDGAIKVNKEIEVVSLKSFISSSMELRFKVLIKVIFICFVSLF